MRQQSGEFAPHQTGTRVRGRAEWGSSRLEGGKAVVPIKDLNLQEMLSSLQAGRRGGIQNGESLWGWRVWREADQAQERAGMTP